VADQAKRWGGGQYLVIHPGAAVADYQGVQPGRELDQPGACRSVGRRWPGEPGRAVGQQPADLRGTRKPGDRGVGDEPVPGRGVAGDAHPSGHARALSVSPTAARVSRRISEYLRDRMNPSAPASSAALTEALMLAGVTWLTWAGVGTPASRPG